MDSVAGTAAVLLNYLDTELCKGVSMDTGVAYPKSDGSSASYP